MSRWGGQVFVMNLRFGDFGQNINNYSGNTYLELVRKSGSFVGGLDAQMTLTLEDKCDAKVN